MKTTFEQRAEIVFQAVMAYLDQTARKHECAGWDCVVCSLHAERGSEMKDAILKALMS